MCLIAFAWQTSKHHRLTLIGNRDEFHRRPTRPLDWWDDLNQPDILAGRDLEAGGTWLGVTRDGRFAAVTNIRAPGAAKAPLSRGQLPLDYLQGRQTPEAFMQQLAAQREQYSGFNLLVGDAAKAEAVLGWKPKTTFTDLVEMMVDHDLEAFQRQGSR